MILKKSLMTKMTWMKANMMMSMDDLGGEEHGV